MSLSAHITKLESRKAELESLIHAEITRPAPDFTVVRDLKKKKLQVKEKMQELAQKTMGSFATG